MNDQLVQEVRSLRETVLTLCKYIGPHLSRDQMCARYDVSHSTLARRVKLGYLPKPGTDGKWLLSEVMEWEDVNRSEPARQV
jgi:hypothetical protein